MSTPVPVPTRRASKWSYGRENPTAFARTGCWNWPSTTHLASCPSLNPPTISSDEPKNNCRSLRGQTQLPKVALHLDTDSLVMFVKASWVHSAVSCHPAVPCFCHAAFSSGLPRLVVRFAIARTQALIPLPGMAVLSEASAVTVSTQAGPPRPSAP